MKKFLLIYAVGATLLLALCVAILRRTHLEAKRLRNNNEALVEETKLYETRLGESAASVKALELELDEYRKQYAREQKRIKRLGIRLRDVESVATSATRNEAKIVAPLHDTLALTATSIDTISLFRWSDRWSSVEGIIRNGKIECNVRSVDTIRQIIHRVPRRFLFFRYGMKGIRQEITSSNPNTQIVYTEYVELPKRRKGRK